MTEELVAAVLANLPVDGAVTVSALQAQLAPGLGAEDDPSDVPKALEKLLVDGQASESPDGWFKVQAPPKTKEKLNG